jgi:acetate---CoA ligase (ADP-forming)
MSPSAQPLRQPAETPPLTRLLQPRSIAIVGASADARTINGQVLSNLQRRGFKGELYPVNPKYNEIGGLRCFAGISAIPGTPDLAIVLLGASHAVQAVTECGSHGIPFACVIGAGFAELGAEGKQLQVDLIAAARRHGIRLVGPNCIGLMNVPANVFAGFGPIFGMSDLKAGPVSMATQSGGFGFGVVNMAEEMGIGFRHVVSTGNEADLTSMDFFDAFIDDPGTRVLAGYFEGIKDAHRLPDVARRSLGAHKPVIVWKVGDTPEGQRAAASHTGNLGGAAALYRAAFDQFGWVQIDDVHELVDCVRAFESGKLPKDANVGIVSVSGGAGVLLADRCAMQGMRVPSLAESTRKRLAGVLPSYASTQNPVDITATVLNDPSLVRRALEIILEDDGVASLIVVPSSVEGPMAESIAAELVALNASTSKPIFVSWNARESRVGDAYHMLDAAKVPLYRTPSRCCRALAAAHLFSQALRRHARDAAQGGGTAVQGRGVALPSVRNEHEAKQFLSSHGLAAPAEVLANNEEDAIAAAERIGYPVALKIQSPDIAHKTEVGGVRLQLSDAAAVKAAFHEVLANARARAPGARVDGVLIQEMVSGGIETILGVVNDGRFGPAIMFGLGGIYAELMQDVVFRFAPIKIDAAREMVASIRGYEALRGARGRPSGDLGALARAIVCLSQLIEKYGDEISEIDINPLVVLPEGRGVRVVDALIVPKLETARPSNSTLE